MKLKTVLILVLFLVAAPLFAQGGASAAADERGKWVAITAGFSMAIASGLCGLASQGRCCRL